MWGFTFVNMRLVVRHEDEPSSDAATAVRLMSEMYLQLRSSQDNWVSTERCRELRASRTVDEGASLVNIAETLGPDRVRLPLRRWSWACAGPPASSALPFHVPNAHYIPDTHTQQPGHIPIYILLREFSAVFIPCSQYIVRYYQPAARLLSYIR